MDSDTVIEINAMKEDIKEIKEDLKSLPDTITAKLDTTVELKIEVAKKEIEMKFYKWLSGITIGLLATMGTLIYELIKE